jgi:hypothetical protein
MSVNIASFHFKRGSVRSEYSLNSKKINQKNPALVLSGIEEDANEDLGRTTIIRD